MTTKFDEMFTEVDPFGKAEEPSDAPKTTEPRKREPKFVPRKGEGIDLLGVEIRHVLNSDTSDDVKARKLKEIKNRLANEKALLSGTYASKMRGWE